MAYECSSVKELVSHYQDVHNRLYRPHERSAYGPMHNDPHSWQNERTAISIELDTIRSRINAFENRIEELERKNRKLLDILAKATYPLNPQMQQLSVESIIKLVCQSEGVCRQDLVGQGRTAKFLIPRQIVYYLAVKLTGRSLPHIGRMLGGRDHATVHHGCSKITELRMNDPILDAKLKTYEQTLFVETSLPEKPRQEVPDGAGKVHIGLECVAK